MNQKVYIGQTSETIKKRFARHMGYQKEEHDTKFYRAIRKYGKENFKIEAIDFANTQSELDQKEIYYIHLYDSVKQGYNSKESIGKCGKLNPFAKKCKAISIDGSEIKYFDTLTDMKEYFNVTTLGMVTMRCQGKTKSPYNGYYFRYCEDDEKS